MPYLLHIFLGQFLKISNVNFLKGYLKIIAICSDMDGLGGHYAKWNKSDRERQILYDITYVESKKHNKLVNITKKKWTHSYRGWTHGYQWGMVSGRSKQGIED